MVILTELREQVTEALTAAGFKAVSYVAENLSPPCVVVIPGSPYVAQDGEGIPFGHYSVNINVLVITGKGTNQASAEHLDSQIVSAIDALDDWDVTEVSQPGQVTLSSGSYLGTVLSIEQTIKL